MSRASNFLLFSLYFILSVYALRVDSDTVIDDNTVIENDPVKEDDKTTIDYPIKEDTSIFEDKLDSLRFNLENKIESLTETIKDHCKVQETNFNQITQLLDRIEKILDVLSEDIKEPAITSDTIGTSENINSLKLSIEELLKEIRDDRSKGGIKKIMDEIIFFAKKGFYTAREVILSPQVQKTGISIWIFICETTREIYLFLFPYIIHAIENAGPVLHEMYRQLITYMHFAYQSLTGVFIDQGIKKEPARRLALGVVLTSTLLGLITLVWILYTIFNWLFKCMCSCCYRKKNSKEEKIGLKDTCYVTEVSSITSLSNPNPPDDEIKEDTIIKQKNKEKNRIIN